jgi:hypothetical protein
MKRLVVLLLVVAMLFTLFACARKHYDETNIHEKYDKEWIIGKSREKIIRRYGAFNREYTSNTDKKLGAYYVNYENYGIDPSYIHDTYFIVFDDDNIAIDAYFSETSKGG